MYMPPPSLQHGAAGVSAQPIERRGVCTRWCSPAVGAHDGLDNVGGDVIVPDASRLTAPSPADGHACRPNTSLSKRDGEYAPIPPVFLPLSPSNTLLWS